ncbi:MAG: hypothetical protein QOH18_1289 [Solirubrobacterales bacterium]|nr:hypothetical protein [Solirubrobacterales bacterium]
MGSPEPGDGAADDRLPVIWDDYILFAGGLAGERSEASQRSAISRAYYGAFNLARRWVEAHVEPIENRAAHKQVWKAFKRSERASESTRLKWKLVGDLGDTLRLLRNQADYADDLLDLDRHAPEAVARARRILTLLAELETVD